MFLIDIEITTGSEFMVIFVQGMTDRGVDFVESYMPKRPADLYVIDSDRIILPENSLRHLTRQARVRGLSIKEKKAAV